MKFFENIETVTITAITNGTSETFAKTVKKYENMNQNYKECVTIDEKKFVIDEMNASNRKRISDAVYNSEIVLVSDDVDEATLNFVIDLCNETCTNIGFLKQGKWYKKDFSQLIEDVYEARGFDGVAVLCAKTPVISKLASFLLAGTSSNLVEIDKGSHSAVDDCGTIFEFYATVNGVRVIAQNNDNCEWTDVRQALNYYFDSI